MKVRKPSNHSRQVAPHGGAWIEIACRVFCAEYAKSPLTEGRGLKCEEEKKLADRRRSPLTEGRGLKLP